MTVSHIISDTISHQITETVNIKTAVHKQVRRVKLQYL